MSKNCIITVALNLITSAPTVLVDFFIITFMIENELY